MDFKTHISYNYPMKTKSFLRRFSFSTVFIIIFAVTSAFSGVYNAVSGHRAFSNPEYSILYNLSLSKVSDGDLPDWALLDPDKDGYEGTRTKTFFEYINSLPEAPQRSEVIVAVIDSGFDINHPALKNRIWQNEAEVNGVAGVDDDGNGYIDDFNGWNFLGDVKYSNYEMTREFRRLKMEKVPESDPYYQKVVQEMKEERDEVEGTLSGLKQTMEVVEDAYETLKSGGYPTDPEKLQLVQENLSGKYREAANKIMTAYLLFGVTKEDLDEYIKEYTIKDKYLFDTTMAHFPYNDNPNVLDEKGYGNNDVSVDFESHGTHVSGIIAGEKDGIGQAPFAKIMTLRAVPNEGDERDKDIGNAIRYAVDNGADIINMSAGKYYSPNPEYVVDAINYAKEKGVLFVVSAGNEALDVEKTVNYPRKYYVENGQVKSFDNMIVVGASTWMKSWNEDKDPDDLAQGFDLAAPFSNYSETVVDVFAPGLEINSTIPGSKYERISGTSMASPEVAGVAAVLKAYFPYLTPEQIKETLINSVRKYDGLKVKVRGKNSKMDFEKMSKSGGVIDLMNAFEYARTHFTSN
ncbi:MAG: S8 family serine peptidase [Ignavibacteriae bacterium]|nr:S8 family serine peptidase [Ignavibacteriota bacterium]